MDLHDGPLAPPPISSLKEMWIPNLPLARTLREGLRAPMRFMPLSSESGEVDGWVEDWSACPAVGVQSPSSCRFALPPPDVRLASSGHFLFAMPTPKKSPEKRAAEAPAAEETPSKKAKPATPKVWRPLVACPQAAIWAAFFWWVVSRD